MSEKESNLICETNEIPGFWQGIKVGETNINIYANFECSLNNTCGIPSSSLYDNENNKTDYSVIHIEDDDCFVEASNDLKRLVLHCKSDYIKKGHPLLHLAVCLSERERQLSGGVLTHGAAVETPHGRGIVFLGNQGAGKTTMAINLGLRGYSLIGNDQIFLERPEPEFQEVFLTGGTQFLRIRESAVISGHIPVSRDVFKMADSTSWNNKIELYPEAMGINISNKSPLLDATFLVHIDPKGEESTHLERVSHKDIQTNLFLGEKFARHISGVATHVLSDDGLLLSHVPSLDDVITQKNRKNLINLLYEKGVYRLSGSNILEMIHAVESVL